jgi:cytochrome c peroxidase
MKRALFASVTLVCLGVMLASAHGNGNGNGAPPGHAKAGQRLFEDATFGGNGRTCQTCHDPETGTLSPEDARRRFRRNPHDPLFRHDGSDDFNGHGVTRITTNATILVNVPLAPNVSLADDPEARFVTVRRGVASTINTPALDPVLMLDGRQPTLEAQAAGAIADHAEGVVPSLKSLHAIAEFQKTSGFFSSPELRRYASGGPKPGLPRGRSTSEKRGRRFFEDVPPDPSQGLKPGLCAHCHSGALLNTTNEFAKAFIPSPAPIPEGQRFLSVGVSEFNAAGNPVREFVFNQGTPQEVHVFSPDPGRALTTGVVDDPTLEHVNAFKISPLRGIRNTAPYFHDNSARTLEDVAAHYAKFFFVASGGLIQLTPQDEADIVAYMKLLD